MTQDIRDFVTPSCELLALGEPAHKEPAFAWVRNELFSQLAGLGFRSIALEVDRAAALIVNDFVQDGVGTLDTVMSEGFSTGFGAVDANRHLVTWMRHHNENRPPEEQLTFHGFDAEMENTSAPSPRIYLEYARDYLNLDQDLSLVGDDEQWNRTEAILDPTKSIGATPQAEALRAIADDMLTSLYARAPELIAATSRAHWFRAKTHLTTALGLLRYHKQSAQRIDDETARISSLLATRDALMAQNLLDIRTIEARRGPTLVFAHNVHLQRSRSAMPMAGMTLTWFSAGAILASLLDDRYTFIASTLGRSETLNLQAPEPDTYEGFQQSRTPIWALTPATAIPPANTRTDTTPQQGYFPLNQETLDKTDAILHISDPTPTITQSQSRLRPTRVPNGQSASH
ncbi:erythromycin esterase-like protein [Kibdelosporangium banguiense]|uniref:Erythromycin esterase-like protein n=1 Tax=Kibdelosporangium banguiense TaxID=1365924 RepID=A0ABS4TIW3_9PSEU|nr:erythromycin esterase family protein [Kibdelosporangium banguiense]MBP2324358.1 erythromycin esterase-like protein [Kibdelosporangium banguiense]